MLFVATHPRRRWCRRPGAETGCAWPATTSATSPLTGRPGPLRRTTSTTEGPAPSLLPLPLPLPLPPGSPQAPDERERPRRNAARRGRSSRCR
ncbi:hypothetical protein [Streptomyces sp. NPDC058145]|uniref:hypothetical protein n=1 Tax=Streptomyces sp. NPDC058145 TaxID=3346356 RepID=UPI0036F12D80